jgi:tetratricopeptide (TPR) repeat protein
MPTQRKTKMTGTKSTFFLYSVLFSIALLSGSCSQTKNTPALRGWHNMNARYNGYFNSKEVLKESIKKVEKANKDDFTKMLPLFVYPDNESSKNFYNDFDNTIKKSSVVIQHHVIMNPKSKLEIPNACRWIDENYMLIGKSHLYKRDLFSALEAFEYVSKIYPQPKAKYAGKIWMIRADNEIGSYSLSEELIDEIRSAKDFPRDRAYDREFALACADLYMKRADYPQAIRHLTRAIGMTRKKITKARYIYILAQLYEKTGDTQKASLFYSMVPKLHPNYDMAFSAQINRARFYDVGEGGSKRIKKQLMRMLRDDKNVDYKDQIYYALAEVSHKEGDLPLTVDYLNSSIKASTSNTTQKALSYLKRGDIYFDRPDYKQAQANYDSAVTILPKDYPNYKEIETKKNSLTDLITNLNVITTEDSVQLLARMSEPERNHSIDKMIKQMEADEKKAEEASKLQKEQVLSATPVIGNPVSVSPTPSSSWYFYNPTNVNFGISDFNKKWGKRKLEDNWRRSEKDLLLAGNEEEEASSDSIKTKKDSTAKTLAEGATKDRNYYLKNIPLTNEALTASNIKIVDAYYNAGGIYKEQLMNNQKSVETFEELLKRYPDNKYRLSSYYQLYRTYLVMNNQGKSDYYKNLILTNFPDSEYAKIIKNPDYAKDINASRSLVERFYAETYQLYSEGKYAEALAGCMKADSLYSKSYLMPQFSFLKALSIGRTQDINAFEAALTDVVIKYPKSPVKEKAQEILDLIKKQKNPDATTVTSKDTTVNTPKKPTFVFNESGEYYWLLIAENGKGNLDNFKIKLSEINKASFSTKNIGISSVFLDAAHQLISVKPFDGKAEAMKYYDFMKSKKDAYSDLNEGSYQSFIISAENYTTFYKDKNVSEYEQFFTQNFK